MEPEGISAFSTAFGLYSCAESVVPDVLLRDELNEEEEEELELDEDALEFDTVIF